MSYHRFICEKSTSFCERPGVVPRSQAAHSAAQANHRAKVAFTTRTSAGSTGAPASAQMARPKSQKRGLSSALLPLRHGAVSGVRGRPGKAPWMAHPELEMKYASPPTRSRTAGSADSSFSAARMWASAQLPTYVTATGAVSG